MTSNVPLILNGTLRATGGFNLSERATEASGSESLIPVHDDHHNNLEDLYAIPLRAIHRVISLQNIRFQCLSVHYFASTIHIEPGLGTMLKWQLSAFFPLKRKIEHFKI